VFAATASYGQGITTTPLQMVQAYAALGNGGKLVKPYIVSESIYPDGSREITKPQIVRQVIKPQSSRLITAMMVDVVEHGHGKRAGVPGYYVAGKTGTAQVSDPNGKGYLKDETIGSFAGFAPADHPAFVMLVKIDHPRTVQYAESSAAPIFGELSSFLLSYLQIPPVRPIKPPAPPSLPTPAPSTSTAR
jgi:cell division protein FtsI/penicillin-binding protein 2